MVASFLFMPAPGKRRRPELFSGRCARVHEELRTLPNAGMKPCVGGCVAPSRASEVFGRSSRTMTVCAFAFALAVRLRSFDVVDVS